MSERNDLECHICGRAFRLRSSLKVHISTHKRDGILEGKSAEGVNTSDIIQEELLELLEESVSPKKYQSCSLPSYSKTHLIDCKAKSLHCNSAKVKKIPSLEDKDKCLLRDENISLSSGESEVAILDFPNNLDSYEENVISRTESSASIIPPNNIESENEIQVLVLTSSKDKERNSLQIRKADVVKLCPDSIDTPLKKVKRKNNEPKNSKLKGENGKSKVEIKNRANNRQKIRKGKGIKGKHEMKNIDSENDEPKTDLSGSADSDVIGAEKRQTFLCETCGKTFTKRGRLRCHMKYHSSEFKCHTCGKVFLSQLSLSNHNDSKKCSEKSMTCRYCSQKYSKRAALIEHIRRDHSDAEKRKIECDICKRVVSRKRIQEHKRIHTGERRYQCEFCGARFGQKPHLKKHMEVHTNPVFQCKLCCVSYVLEETLRKHILKFHAEEDIDDCVKMRPREEVMKCSQCDLQFPTKILLREHERTHGIDGNLPPTGGNLPHARSNLPLDKKCSYCDKMFSVNALRKIHEMIHTGEKPFKCSFCDKRFRLHPILKAHVRTHTKERPFNCETCGKSFTQKTHLNAHKVLHTGEKPFECQYCGVSFAAKSNLHAHKKKNCKQMHRV